MLKASQPLKLTIIYELNMLINDKLLMHLFCKDDHIWDTKHKDVKRGPTMDIIRCRITCGWWTNQGVECVDIPCEGEHISWGKVKGMQMIKWWNKIGS
jgi:hypothetical protein